MEIVMYFINIMKVEETKVRSGGEAPPPPRCLSDKTEGKQESKWEGGRKREEFMRKGIGILGRGERNEWIRGRGRKPQVMKTGPLKKHEQTEDEDWET